MDRAQLLRKIKARLAEAYGDAFRWCVLYGAVARGDAGPDSDVGIMVLLDHSPDTWDDYYRAASALYDLMLEHGIIIDAKPVDSRLYQTANAPLYVMARKEGIPA